MIDVRFDGQRIRHFPNPNPQPVISDAVRMVIGCVRDSVRPSVRLSVCRRS